jgi:hypothetical protein
MNSAVGQMISIVQGYSWPQSLYTQEDPQKCPDLELIIRAFELYDEKCPKSWDVSLALSG